jgi:hypothetical protein
MVDCENGVVLSKGTASPPIRIPSQLRNLQSFLGNAHGNKN